jgi:hypothetical protein
MIPNIVMAVKVIDKAGTKLDIYVQGLFDSVMETEYIKVEGGSYKKTIKASREDCDSPEVKEEIVQRAESILRSKSYDPGRSEIIRAFEEDFYSPEVKEKVVQRAESILTGKPNDPGRSEIIRAYEKEISPPAVLSTQAPSGSKKPRYIRLINKMESVRFC